MRRHLKLAIAALAAACASLGPSAAEALAHAPATPPAPATPSARSVTGAAPAHKPAPTRKPKLRVAPVGAKPTLYVFDAFVVHHQTVDVPGRLMRVTGIVRPYVPGQRVVVSSFLGRRRFKTDTLRVKPGRGGRAGHFVERLRAPGAGIVHVEVVHSRTRRMAGFTVSRAVASLAASTRSPRFVSLVQQRLDALHFYLPATGVWDQRTGLAVDAYHRLLGQGTSQSLDPGRWASCWTARLVHRPLPPGRQARGGEPGQPGAGADQRLEGLRAVPDQLRQASTPTILGRFRVYLRDPGYLPDGMYFSDFFTGGYAIHGYDPAPDYPASTAACVCRSPTRCRCGTG